MDGFFYFLKLIITEIFYFLFLLISIIPKLSSLALVPKIELLNFKLKSKVTLSLLIKFTKVILSKLFFTLINKFFVKYGELVSMKFLQISLIFFSLNGTLIRVFLVTPLFDLNFISKNVFLVLI